MQSSRYQLALLFANVSTAVLCPTLAVRMASAGDFNGDGYDDAALGVSGDSLLAPQSGAVQIIYGSRIGLSVVRCDEISTTTIRQGANGAPDQSEQGDWYGQTLACGDFDGDGFDDLAVGDFAEDLDSVVHAGAVHVFYGSPLGLRSDRSQNWHYGPNSLGGVPLPGDQLGWALAAGDFNGDEIDDLAMSVPYKDVGSATNAGLIHVLFGSQTFGLTSAGMQDVTQDSPGVPDLCEGDDCFGLSLTAADFDADGFTDLVVGVPCEDIGQNRNCGAINVVFGSSSGLAARGQFFTQDSTQILDKAEQDDLFGQFLCASNQYETSINGDAFADLIIGIPFEETVDGVGNSGAVAVLFGAATGLAVAGNQFWTQDNPDAVDSVEKDDYFGWAVSIGDYDADGFSDVAIGVPQESFPSSKDDVHYSGRSQNYFGNSNQCGAVAVVMGSPTGLSSRNLLLYQGSPGMGGQPGPYEWFGYSLSTSRRSFNDDEYSDLLIGAIHDNSPPAYRAAGGMHVLYGTTLGLDPTRSRFFDRSGAGMDGVVGTGDLFGSPVLGD